MARLVDDLDQGARRAEAGERERHDAILLDVVLGRGVGTPLPQTRRRAWSVHAWSVHGQCMVSAWSVHGQCMVSAWWRGEVETRGSVYRHRVG